MQPGDTITPEPPKNQPEDTGGELKIPRENGQLTPQVNIPPSPPQVTFTPPSPEPELPPEPVLMARTPETEPTWEESQDASSPALPNDAPIVWTASEFVDHEKSANWFFALAALTAVVLIIAYVITRDLITIVVLALAATLFGVTAKRKPRIVHHQLDNTGVSVGKKFYGYETFKSFSVVEEAHFNSIQLIPLKRFSLPLNLYYPPEEESHLVAMIGNYLPHEKRKQDPVDKLMRKVRF